MDLNLLNLADLHLLRQRKYNSITSHIYDIDSQIRFPNKDIDSDSLINYFDILLRDIDNIDFHIKNKILVQRKWKQIERDNYQKLLSLLPDNFVNSFPISNPDFFK